MRIGEEANLYGVQIKIIHSDSFQVNVRGADGDPFHVLAYYGSMCLSTSGKLGWWITKDRPWGCVPWAVPLDDTTLSNFSSFLRLLYERESLSLAES